MLGARFCERLLFIVKYCFGFQTVHLPTSCPTSNLEGGLGYLGTYRPTARNQAPVASAVTGITLSRNT